MSRLCISNRATSVYLAIYMLLPCCVQPHWEGPVGFYSWEASGWVQKPLKLSVVNLNCDDIFIMFKSSTHSWGLDGALSEPLCKVKPLQQQSNIYFAGNAVEDFDCNVSNHIV